MKVFSTALLASLLFALLTFPAAASMGDSLQDGSPLFALFAIGLLGLLVSRRKFRH
jgi:hypothetical protein